MTRKNPITIREYESLTTQANPGEGFHCLGKKDFETVEAFIEANRRVSDDDADTSELLRITSKKGYGKVITAKNHVGLIQLRSGLQIEILPKISLTGKDEEFRGTKKVFLDMLRSLKEFQGKSFNFADLNTSRMYLYEVFVSKYLDEVGNLIRHGLRSDYITLEDNLNYYKGKLIVREHLKRNLIHQERFYVAYDEYHINRAENRLIKSTLLMLQKLNLSFANQKLIRQHLAHFEMVEESKNIDRDFEKVVVDRNTKDYGTLMNWSNVFLRNKSFTTFSGATNACALLFPMDRIFESHVAKELRKAVPEDWRVSTQDRGHYLFDWPNKRFALRPDIVITRLGNTNDNKPKKIILDTKWKVLVDDPGINYGISPSDMYQMYAYAKKYETPHIWLLYPKNEAMRNVKPLEIRYESRPKKDGVADVSVNLFFVDLEKPTNISDLVGLLKDTEGWEDSQ